MDKRIASFNAAVGIYIQLLDNRKATQFNDAGIKELMYLTKRLYEELDEMDFVWGDKIKEGKNDSATKLKEKNLNRIVYNSTNL